MMPFAAEFIAAEVIHARVRPAQNRFRYRVPYVAIPACALDAKTRHGVLSIDGANLFSVRTRDYGCGEMRGAPWIREVLTQQQLHAADGEIVLVTIPRILGFAFNPVSFWLCFDTADALRDVVAEVNNTFGERHFYLCCHDDQRPIAAHDRIVSAKAFHVSPFMTVEGEYRFSFAWGAETLGIRIDLHDRDGLLLTTTVAGKRQALSNGRLLRALIANPLVMFKVLGLIHYQAARLFLKGVALFGKPPLPAETVTRSAGGG
jgi:uncharacterized protein